jgi:hypothetical protein
MSNNETNPENGSENGAKSGSFLDAILTRKEPVTANTDALFEKVKENPDAFVEALNARVNQHLGFSTSKSKKP